MLDLLEGQPGAGVPGYMISPEGLPIWATEHKCGNYPWNPTGINPGTGLAYPTYVYPAPNDQAYGVESWDYIRNAINAGVTSYNASNMILGTDGRGNDSIRSWSQNALLVVNTATLTIMGMTVPKTLIPTPAYYVFRHCSQYVQNGATVVGTSGGDAIAFKNPDGSVVAIMYNSGSAAPYVVSIKGTLYQFSMPGNGWATVVVP